MKYALEIDEPVADGLVRVIRGQIRKLRGLAATSADDPDEFVRQARVVSKRIRAALKLARPMMSRRANRATRDWWRDQARGLSETRDLAARVDAMGALGDTLSEAAGDRLAAGLKSRFERDLARGAAAHEADGPVADFLIALADAPAPDPHAMKGGSFLVLLDAYSRGYRKARHAMARAVESGEVELFHEWRKSAKAHALQTKLLRRLSPMLEARAEAARELALRLGELQDIAVSRAGLEAMASPPGGKSGRAKLASALTEREAEAMGEARRMGRTLFALKPHELREGILAERAAALIRERVLEAVEE